MAALRYLWCILRGYRIMKAYGIVLLLITDVCLKSVYGKGYLSSPHVGQESFSRDAQYSPVITSPVVPAVSSASPVQPSDTSKCPSGGLCSKLPADCVTCSYQEHKLSNCTYGRPASFSCKPNKGVHCTDESGTQQTEFNQTIACQFCWQLDPSLYRCKNETNCMTVACPRRRYNTTCKVLDHIHCLGKREFKKRLFCNWTGGYKWSTALALSITLGGFGADRFYLGQWREGLGKLFSFGGLGIWTLIDVLLIGVGYVGPADGSLYI
ncbi:TM2 domain-containing protein 3 isoform X1 [Sardina pilchardus]|uniref:TM2 domain-containing protein 3 isoform X1 n=1 Tax=Sardina pilchardus TaxID=27697 RepID=UPI002E0E93A5